MKTIRLGHESPDVTLAYLKGKDAESEGAPDMGTAAARATSPITTASIKSLIWGQVRNIQTTKSSNPRN
jgi:hypothetical protein